VWLLSLASSACGRSAGTDERRASPSIARDAGARRGDSPANRAQSLVTTGPVGVVHEELLRRADAENSAGTEAPTRIEGHGIPEDRAFDDETPVDVTRAHFAVQIPDERADHPAVERVLRMDDQGDRLLALLYGTGLVLAPGLRIGGRASMAGWALVGADGGSHRAMSPDALRRWFFGAELAPAAALSFARGDRSVNATRGGLTVAITLDATGPARPLACRLFVSLLLGGDPAAIREGCVSATSPSRVVLRARGRPSLSFVRARTEVVRMPRDAMAVPPRAAVERALAVPARALEGGFFSPSELATILPVPSPGRPRPPSPVASALEIHNGTDLEQLLFLDDVAIGWLGGGRTVTYAGISSGRHIVRARSADGLRVSEPTMVSAPGRWDLAPDPQRTR
jgi:hypothetical protein